MKRLMRFLLGLTVGAAIAILFAPKSGRELRQQLAGGATSRLLPPAPDDYPLPEGKREWGTGPATAVAEPPVVDESVTVAETVAVTEEGLVEDTVVVTDTVTFAEPQVAAPPWEDAGPAMRSAEVAAAPEVAEEPPVEDLRVRIEETRSAIETDIAEPFAFAGTETPVAAEEPVEPVVAEPVAEEVVVEPVVEEVVAEPVVAEPVAAEEPAELVVAEPVAEEVVAEEPAEPVVAPPEVFEGPVYQEPAAEAAPSVEPVVEATPPEAPRAWEVWQDEGSAEEPVAAAEPVAEVPDVVTAEPEPIAEPAAEPEPIVEPVAEVAEEPVAELAEELAGEAPAPAREGGAIDQAEMRRRIEETRARLKAKAFDAMMSGEAALLRNDSGEKPLPKGDGVDLEPEIDTTIDESFSQEDY